MNTFELIKTVLDDAFKHIVAANDDDKIQTLNEQINALTGHYQDLTDRRLPPLDYSDPSARFAYIYKYTTCHANIVAEKVALVPEIRELLSRDAGWIDVACIGGGPGSDFLGLVKHMIRNGGSASLKCYLLDKEPAWGDSWADVDRRTDKLDFRVSTHAQVLDVTQPATWAAQTRYLTSDLFTFTYFISEIARFWEQAHPYFAHLFSSAKPGALFLFIDNNKDAFYKPFDSLAKASGLHRLAGSEHRFVLDWDEEKTALDPYYTLLSHQPKVQTWIAWRAYVKR